MKRLVTSCVMMGLMALTASAAPLPSDDFNDDSMNTSLWNLYEDDYSIAWLDETNQRLELRSASNITGDRVAVYVANGWGFSTEENFSFRADFHNSFTSLGEAWVEVLIGIGKGTDLAEIYSNNAIVDADWDKSSEDSQTNTFFGYSYCIDDVEFWSEEERSLNDGTLYVSYDAAADELYLSHTGYGQSNASDTISGLLKGLWGCEVVTPFIGGDVENAILDSGEAYLDNFIVDGGTVVPEPATICLLSLGSLVLLRRKTKA